MALPELEWHVIDDVDFDGVENDIPEIIQGPAVPVLGNIEPVSTNASKQTLVLMKTSFAFVFRGRFQDVSRRLEKTFSGHLQNVFNRLPKMSSRHL